ncbi:MAG: energy transducer TonB [Deltaproteobacteria bacterium]|nr:energy transducer TonB [Deltaproteobacteria bacterium]
MKWPLIGSVAGHIALLAFLLLFIRAAAGPGFPGAVQVVLVETAKAEGVHAERTTAGVRGGATPAPRAPAVTTPESPAPIARDIALPSLPPSAPPASASILVPSQTASHRFPDRVAAIAPSPASAGPASAGGGTGPAFSHADGWKDASVSGREIPGGAVGGEGREIGLLREKIESRIVYPEEAVRRGQEGEVVLRIRVGDGGMPREIRIARSSGARVLDEAARTGVTSAAPLPSRPGWFEVPVRFFLR